MISRARRGAGQGGPRADSNRRRPASKAVVGVETLEGRTLLSYLVVTKNHKVVPIHTGDARDNEPLFSNGLAFKHQAHFYPFYTGPKRPELNGIKASAQVFGNLAKDGNLILSGTVAAPIIQNPKSPAQWSVYVFGIDRGGAAERGPFPGRPNIRFDTVVVAAIRQNQTAPYHRLLSAQRPVDQSARDAPGSGNQSGDPRESNYIPASLGRRDRRSYHNDHRPAHFDSANTTPTFASGTNLLTSSGKAIDQWNVNFFTRNPLQKPNFQSVASLTPEFTDFQVFVPQPHYHQP